MVRKGVGLLLFLALILALAPVSAQTPVASKGDPEAVSHPPSLPGSFLTKIALWQQQLKAKMAGLMRQAKTTERIAPIVTVLLIAFGYGVIHAAGPGHGKAVAMSFMLSRKASIGSGLLFGALVAFFHGFSGAVCVLALHYILQKTVSTTLGSISHTTQIVSFSLIILLGFGILVKNCYALRLQRKPGTSTAYEEPKASTMALIPWALTVGLVPCPGVVMVLLFCLSMGMLTLGLLLAAAVSLGMAATISFVVLTVVIGRGISLHCISSRRTRIVEHLVGLASGLAVTALGLVFLASILR
jgi:ABC-type nickel/cobalt efflux system permease component RcnA